MKIIVKEAKYGITEGGIACGPIDGNVVGSVQYACGDITIWINLVDMLERNKNIIRSDFFLF